MKCSVIICTLNPREDYLNRVLGALRAQTLPASDWELVLVDNASKNPLADRFDLSWHPHSRHVREEALGLAPARMRGIKETTADILVFVDDDNILRSDYLEASCAIAASHPFLGAWNGSCVPEFEIEPPANIRPWLSRLTIQKIEEPIWAKLRAWSEACPCGAGLCVRRPVAEQYRQALINSPLRRALGRSGSSLGAGEDIDLVLNGFDLGFGAGRFPELELTHLIPAQRLTVEHLAGVLYGFGYSGVVLGFIHQKNFAYPIRNQSRIFLNWLVLLRHKGPVRRLKLAHLRGSLRAFRDLKRMGYLSGRT